MGIKQLMVRVDMNLKREKGNECIGEFRGRKYRGECSKCIIISVTQDVIKSLIIWWLFFFFTVVLLYSCLMTSGVTISYEFSILLDNLFFLCMCMRWMFIYFIYSPTLVFIIFTHVRLFCILCTCTHCQIHDYRYFHQFSDLLFRP